MENQIAPIKFLDINPDSKFSDFKAGHVGIRTNKIDELLKWYEKNLDFRIIKRWNVGDIRLAFMASPADNDFIIEVICYDRNEKYTDGLKSGYNHLSFWVDSLSKTTKELEKNGIPIQRSFSVPEIAMTVAFIDDTFGNSIELCQKMTD